MLGGALSYYFGTWCDFRGLELTTASLERALLFAYPAFVVLLRAVAKRQPPPPRVVLALGMTYAGICLAVGVFDTALWRANAPGAGLVLVSALTFAVYLLINERLAPRLGSVGYVAVAMTAAASCFVVHFLLGAPPSALDLAPRAWAGVLLMTAFTNVLPLLMMAEGVQRIGAQRAAILSSVGPPFTLLAGVVVLGEALLPPQWIGTAVIILGVLVLETGRSRQRGRR
jgi:drug/metabolite transporter (DMT)-like permease